MIMQATAQTIDDAIFREIERVIAREANAERMLKLLEAPGSFDFEMWKLAVEQGWPGLGVSEELGGLGLGWRGLAQTAQILGGSTVSLPLIQSALVCDLIQRAQNAADLIGYGNDLAEGKKIACVALLEGNDAGLTPQSSLTLNDGLLSGSVAQAAFAAVADIAVVRAAANGKQVLVLVELNDNQVRRDSYELVDNARAAAALTFTNSRAVVLQFADDTALNRIITQFAVLTAFEQVGGAAASLELARGYALEHKAFGQVIGSFQAIKHKLADVYTSIEIAKGCAIEALEELAIDKLSIAAAAAARIASNRAYDFAAQECIQVHGGMGVMWEERCHHFYRRARSLALELGASAYWRRVLLSELTK